MINNCCQRIISLEDIFFTNILDLRCVKQISKEPDLLEYVDQELQARFLMQVGLCGECISWTTSVILPNRVRVELGLQL